MAEIPDVLRGVLRKGDYVESLEAIRDMLALELEGIFCDHCHRNGPEPKDIASLTLRLIDVLEKIRVASAPQVTQDEPVGSNVLSIQARSKDRRTGNGTQTTGAPTSVAKRQFGRRSGGGRKPNP